MREELRRDAVRAFEALGRSIKRCASYRHARSKFLEYLQPAYLELSALLAREGSLAVDVEPTALMLEGEPVLAEATLCHRLHRDGIRKIHFARGLLPEEVLAFARAGMPEALEGADAGREDAQIELWKAELKNLSVEAAPIYQVAQSEADRRSFEAAVAEAQKALADAGGTSLPDEEAHALLPALCEMGERDRLDAEAGKQRLQRAALVLVRVMERHLAGRDAEALAEALGRLCDEMLRQRDAPALGALLERVQSLDHAGQPAREVLAARLTDRWRLSCLAEMCASSFDLIIFGMPVYLGLLPPSAGEALLAVLPDVEARDVRSAFAQAAVQRLAHCHEAYEDGLANAPPDVARALLKALEVVPPLQRGPLIAVALGHPNLGVQIEAARALALHEPQLAVPMLQPHLAHADRAHRLAAVEALSIVPLEEAAAALLERMRAPAFDGLDREEREAFHVALGKQRTQAGFAFLNERLTQRASPDKPRIVEEQILAVHGLAAEATPRAQRVLDYAGATDSHHVPVVVAAARAAATHVRDAIARAGLA